VPEGQAGPAVLLEEERSGNDRRQVDAADQAPRHRPDDGMAHVGPVEADDQRARPGEARAPARQPVMGVDEVEGRPLAEQATEAPGGRDVLAGAGGEAEYLDLHLPLADLLDLIAHPAPALGGGGVGHEVGDDEDAHPAERIRGRCGTQG
jgi:hypothetical protein